VPILEIERDLAELRMKKGTLAPNDSRVRPQRKFQIKSACQLRPWSGQERTSSNAKVKVILDHNIE